MMAECVVGHINRVSLLVLSCAVVMAFVTTTTSTTTTQKKAREHACTDGRSWWRPQGFRRVSQMVIQVGATGSGG